MTLKPLLILVFFTTFLQIGNTQEISIDSLEGMSFEELILTLDNSNGTKKRYKITNIYLKKSLKTDDTIQMCRGYYYHAIELKFDKSLKYIDTIIALSKNSKHKLYPTLAYILKAIKYEEKDLLDQAMQNYLIALSYARKKNNTEHSLKIRHAISVLKGLSGDFRGALNIQKSVYDSILQIPNYKKENAAEYYVSLYNLIYDYINVKEYDSAEIYINKALKGFRPIHSKYNINYYECVYLYGITNYYKKYYSKSIDSLEKAIPKIDDFDKSFSHFLLSNIYKSQKREKLFITNAVLAESLAVKSKNDSREFRELYVNLIE